jgi:hypothetical protein
VGIVDADALPTSERPSPAAPSAVTAALVVRFCLEACFTRGMVASFVSFVVKGSTWQVCLCAYKCARVLKRPETRCGPGAADLEAEVYPWGLGQGARKLSPIIPRCQMTKVTDSDSEVSE